MCSRASTACSVSSTPVAAPLSRTHVWLAQPPAPLSPVVWDVVVLACLSALEGGRHALYAARASRDSVLPRATLTRLGVGSARALAVVSFPTPALDCTTLSRWLERAELYYLIIACTPFSLCMQSSQFGPASAASPLTRRPPYLPIPTPAVPIHT